MVQVDSESLVRLLTSGAIAKWPLCNRIRKIQTLFLFFSASIEHIFREANSSTNMLSKLRLPLQLFCTSHDQLPGRIQAALNLDCREFCNVHM